MIPRKRWFACALAVAVSGIAVATDAGASLRYAEEINALRDRERVYVDASVQEIGAIDRYSLAWSSLAARAERIRQAISGVPSAAAQPGASESSARLLALTREKVVVEAGLRQIESESLGLEQDLAAAASAAQLSPALRSRNAADGQEVRLALDTLKAELTARRQRADENIERWTEWQVAAARQAGEDYQRRVLSDLQFRSALNELRSAFLLIAGGFRSALVHGDSALAGDILRGHAWLRSLIPLYLAGQISNEDRASQVRQLQAEAERSEQALADLMSDPGRPAPVALLFRVPDVGGAPGDADPGADHPEPVPPDEPISSDGGSCRDYTDAQGGQYHTDGPVEGKAVAAFGDGSAAAMELRSGFVEIDPPRGSPEMAEVDVPRGEDLKGRVSDEIEKRLEGDGVPRPGEAPEIAASTASLREMVDRCADRARGDARQELEELRDEVNRYQSFQGFYGSLSDQSASRAQSAGSAARVGWAGLGGALPAVPADEAPLGDGSGSSDGAELGRMVADFALGVTPGIGNAYNLANFVSAVATGESILGQPMTTSQTALMGAAAILPFIPRALSAGEAILKVAAFARANPGVIESAGEGAIGTLLKAYGRAKQAGVADVLDKFLGEQPEAIPNLANGMTSGELGRVTPAVANQAAKTALGNPPDFMDAFAADQDVLKITFAEDGSGMVGYRVSKESSSLSPFGALEDPNEFPSRDEYLDLMGLEVNDAGAPRVVLQRYYNQGNSVYVGTVARTQGARGGGLQVMTEAPPGDRTTWRYLDEWRR